MNEGFQNPSKYDYYTNSLKCFSYDTRYYRRTQFDIWPMEDSLQHKRVYYLTYYPVKNISADSIKIPAGNWYGGWVNDLRTYQKIVFETSLDAINLQPGKQAAIKLTFKNSYPFPVSFSNKKALHKLTLEACFLKDDKENVVQDADSSFYSINLKREQLNICIFIDGP